MTHPAAALDRLRQPRMAVIAVVLAALSLAACGSSSSSSSTSATGTAAAASSAGASPGLAAAQASVARYTKLPRALTVTTPLPSAPRRGKTVVILQCEVAQCAEGGAGFRAAAAAIGWNVKTIAWQTTQPATLVNGMQQALAMRPKPYAVAISGLPEALWQSEEATYAKAGVLIVPYAVGPVTVNRTVITDVLAPQSTEEQGRLLADWFIANSQGKGKVLLQNATQYPSLDEVATGFRDEVSAHCPGCSLSTLNVTGAEVDSNQVTSTIVSALKRDTSDGYVMAADIAVAPGLPEALKAAGLQVKVLGGAAVTSDLPDVKTGAIAATALTNQYYSGWQMIDALARHAAGLPVSTEDGGTPEQILTKANVGNFTQVSQAPVNYPSLFKALWHVG